MISVNDLIQNAFSRCGLVGDGQAVNGTKAKTGENELKDLISVLNTQEYIADNYRMFDVGGKNEITIGDSIDFDIQIKNPPSTIKSIGRKQGDRFVQLKQMLNQFLADLEIIFLRNTHTMFISMKRLLNQRP